MVIQSTNTITQINVYWRVKSKNVIGETYCCGQMFTSTDHDLLFIHSDVKNKIHHKGMFKSKNFFKEVTSFTTCLVIFLNDHMTNRPLEAKHLNFYF